MLTSPDLSGTPTRARYDWQAVRSGSMMDLENHYDSLYRHDAEAVRKQLTADFVDHEAPLGNRTAQPGGSVADI
jgi:hypothetical protein